MLRSCVHWGSVAVGPLHTGLRKRPSRVSPPTLEGELLASSSFPKDDVDTRSVSQLRNPGAATVSTPTHREHLCQPHVQRRSHRTTTANPTARITVSLRAGRVPQEGEEGGATLDPRDIGGFDSQYSFHAADEAELDPRAPTDPLVVDEMDLAGVAAMVEEVGGVAALVAAARQEAPAAAGKVQPLRSFTACLRVPGSGWNMKPIFTVCVPASHSSLVGKTSPSLWFPLHEKQPLTCVPPLRPPPALVGK
jgi:hypothetical protein